MLDNIIKKYSNLYASPYLVGVFMGVNAIKDIALFVDGPDCNFFRVDILYKTHDLFSILKDSSINTRLYFSGVMPNKMVLGYEDRIKRKISFIEKNDKFKLGIIVNMPVTSLLGIQYDGIIKDFKKNYLIVPVYTDKFWIDGYSLFLREIAKKIDLNNKKEKTKKSISIIGYLFDRNEGDNLGDIEELKRLMKLIGVEIDSIWLNGGNFDELKRVEDSELLVVLPYGKYAGKVLKKRLQVDILELEVPFGFKNTIDFIKRIGEKLNINLDFIDEVIKEEVKKIKNKTDLLNEKLFLNKNFIYAGDPNLESGIKEFADFLGMNFIRSFSYNGDKIFYDEIDKEKIDFIIGNSDFNIDNESIIKIEFGFPSYNTHYLTNRAFLGFEGVLNFVEKLYNSLGKS